MYTISREYWFSAAHRIEGHPKCGRLHGHNYKVTVAIQSHSLPDNGMLIDYSELDAICKPIIESLDHRYLSSISNMRNDDPYGRIATLRGDAVELHVPASTGEHIAEFLWKRFWDALQESQCRCERGELSVTVSETPKSTALYDFR